MDDNKNLDVVDDNSQPNTENGSVVSDGGGVANQNNQNDKNLIDIDTKITLTNAELEIVKQNALTEAKKQWESEHEKGVQSLLSKIKEKEETEKEIQKKLEEINANKQVELELAKTKAIMEYEKRQILDLFLKSNSMSADEQKKFDEELGILTNGREIDNSEYKLYLQRALVLTNPTTKQNNDRVDKAMLDKQRTVSMLNSSIASNFSTGNIMETQVNPELPKSTALQEAAAMLKKHNIVK